MTTAYETVTDTETASPRDGRIKLHGPEAFAGMRKAGRLAAEILDMLVEHAQPGTTTEALDKLARDYAFANGSMPATLFYRGYRHSLCTSINHVVCHGIPGPKPLKNGDIVNIDVTVVVDGWHGDTSRMYMIGEPRRKAELLVDTTYEAMMAGINAIKPGVTLGTIGAIIQEYAEERRCSIVRDFCGREGSVRWLDRRHPRQVAVGAVRAFRRRHRGRGGDFHVLAQGPRQAALFPALSHERPGLAYRSSGPAA